MPFQNNNNYDELIRQAGQKAGVDPGSLKQSIDSGKLDALLAKMRPQDAARFQQIVNDPKLAEQILSTPQAKLLIKQFMK